jgi:hypothetical protein
VSLADAQAEIAEANEFAHVLEEARVVTELVATLHHMTRLRNRPMPEMQPELLVQRRSIMDIAIRVARAEFKTRTRELVNALEKWEKRDG